MKKRFNRIPSFLFICVLLFLSPSIFAEVFDSIAIRIQNQAITKNEIELAMLQKAQEREFRRQAPLSNEDLKKQVVNELINDSLVKIRADELNIEVTEKEVRDRVKEYKERNKLNDTAFEDLLKNINSNIKQFNRIQLEGIKKQKTLSREVYSRVNVSEESLKKFYESQSNKKLYRIRHLLRQVPVGATKEQEEKAKQEIIYLADQVKNGESFKKLVKEYSEDPSVSENEGVLEFEAENAILPLREAVQKLTPEEYSPPIKTRFGYHLVRLLEIKQGGNQASFDQVKNQLRQELVQKKYAEGLKNFFDSMKRRIPIVFVDSSLKKYANG